MKELINKIEQDINDVIHTDFEYSSTQNVPSGEDSGLSFEGGVKKRGKTISTCVLFVDIRDSVALTQKHSKELMGKLYTAFTKAVIRAAHHHGGLVRNIIGDRVMVVFPVENCFKNAVYCAISINHVSQYVIAKKFKSVNFKCGIGIDYGELRVIKVGVAKKGEERTENRGLVWVGNPANIASRLTDKANKTIEEDYYLVKWYKWRNPMFDSFLRTLPNYNPNNSPYNTYSTDKEMTPKEFASQVRMDSDGKLYLTGGKLVSFEKKTRTTAFKPILITEAVYDRYKMACPNDNNIKNNWWKKVNASIENVQSSVYGVYLEWKLN